MKRRRFLNSLVTGFAALPFVGHAREAMQAGGLRGRETVRELLVQESPVAGFQYHDGETVWPRLSTGDSLRLLREPDNPYDGQAVAVYWGEAKLGYVPRAANTAVAQMMDRGELLSARVARLRESQDPWKRVGISIAARFQA